MRTFSFVAAAAFVLLATTTLSGPAAAANAKEALAGLTSADDSFTHDSGAVSICKGGSFPGCKGGKAFYCPPGGKPCEPTQQARKPKPGVTGVVPGGGILDSNPGFSPQGPGGAGTPLAPKAPAGIQLR